MSFIPRRPPFAKQKVAFPTTKEKKREELSLIGSPSPPPILSYRQLNLPEPRVVRRPTQVRIRPLRPIAEVGRRFITVSQTQKKKEEKENELFFSCGKPRRRGGGVKFFFFSWQRAAIYDFLSSCLSSSPPPPPGEFLD